MVERLLEEGHVVTGYDNFSSGQRKWIEAVLPHPKFTFIQADLLDFNTLTKAMKGHQVVIHLGANTDIPRGNQNPRIDLDNCTVATFNVLESMRTNGNRISRLLFASSSTVYGEVSLFPTPEETGPMLPISLYGAGKMACEGLISAYSHLYGIQAWIFRFGNVVGARMGHGVIYDFIGKLRRNPQELEILGDGGGEKNFFLVEECIDGMFFAYRNVTEKPCDVFNLGCESTTKIMAIAQIVVEEMGLKNVQFRTTGSKRGWPGDVPNVIYDVSKMKKLGWSARCSSTEAVHIATRRLLGKE
jgi:UDP-glucose 4-epimerase